MAPSSSQVVTSTPGASIGVSYSGPCGNMPCATASDCAAGQTFIPPGSKFTSGLMAGQVTPTGGCQDASSSTPTSGCFNPLAQWFTADTCISTSVPIGIFEAAIAAGLLLWLFAGGKK